MIILLPTLLSLIRVVFAMWGVFALREGAYKLSLIILLLAALSDMADGFVARYFNCATIFGAMLDPLSDKVFIFCFLWVFYEMKILPSWFCLFLLIKELGMVGFAIVSVIFSRVTFSANKWGKLNMVAIMGLYLLIHIGLLRFGSIVNWSDLFYCLLQWGIYLCTATGIYAIMSYSNQWLKSLKR